MTRRNRRHVAAYLLDRADQYATDSPCWVALADAANNVLAGDVEAAVIDRVFDDDLMARVVGMEKRARSQNVNPDEGVDMHERAMVRRAP